LWHDRVDFDLRSSLLLLKIDTAYLSIELAISKNFLLFNNFYAIFNSKPIEYIFVIILRLHP